SQLDRVAAMRFDTVAIAPPFATGRAGDLFLTADHDHLDERLGAGDAATALARFAEECRGRELFPMLDVVVDRVPVEPATHGLSTGYRSEPSDELPDPRQSPQRPDVARLATEHEVAGAVDWWADRFAAWVDAGIADFRCIGPHRVPASFWRDLLPAVRRRHPH